MILRRGMALVALLGALAAAPVPAAARPGLGEYVRAARAISEWRYEEARRLADELGKSAPDEPETRFLAAQMAFLDGDYGRARAWLRELAQGRGRELVRDLLPLVEATWEATRTFETREYSHFVFRYPPGKDEVLVDLAAEALEAARARIGTDLGYMPPGKVRVEILPRIADLARVSTLTEREIETSGTIALCKYNKLMIVSPRATLFGYPWLDTLVHEYTHYVVSRATHDKVPIWLHEGIAKFQESRWRAEPGQPGLGRTHEHLLATALKKGRLIGFDEMHPSMAKLPSQEAAATAFAEVYTMVAWLHQRIGYEGLRTVLAKVRDGKTERRAIVEALGARTWPEVEAAWKKHLRGLDLRVEGRAKAPRKLRFKKGRDDGDDPNVGLDLVAEERARNHARLGGLLRARGRLRAAIVEYEKALAAAGGDDPFIGGKLARTYLEAGDARRAVEVARPLADRAEDDAYPLATLGAAYLELGQPAEAEPFLVAAVRVSPFDPAVRCGLERVYRETGREAQAAREAAACAKLRDPAGNSR